MRILDVSERGQGRKTELVEACDFMGIKPKNSSWNHGFQDNTDKEGIGVPAGGVHAAGGGERGSRA